MKIVGMIYGEVGYREFNFLVSKEVSLQKGEYVKVKHELYGWVLAKVKEIKRYHERYSLKAITGATEPQEAEERIVATARVIGYIDGKGMLKAPRMPFKPGEKVYQADAGIIKKTLKLSGRMGVFLGNLEGHQSNIPVFLDPNKLVQKHISVLAKTGAGKSYTVGVLIEELLENRVPVVVIDPHGEYSSLRESNNSPQEIELMERFGIKPRGYRNIVEYSTQRDLNPQSDKKLTLDITRLSHSDFRNILPIKLTNVQEGLLYEALNVVKTYGKYNLDDIIRVLEESESKSKYRLITNLEMLKESKIFDGSPVKISEVVRQGICSIINLRGVPPEIQDIIVSRLSSEIFEQRKKGKIPPLFFLIEEAHNFASERGFGNKISTSVLRTIASEGRKFGLGLCVVTQRPARIDKSVLSQCNTQVILKVTNPNDLKAISHSIENFTPDLEEEIKQLEPGKALIVGDAVEQPLFVDIRVKRSRHGGTGVEVVRKRKKKGPKSKGGGVEGVLKKLFSRY